MAIRFKKPKWSGREDLNFQPHAPKARALPIALRPDLRKLYLWDLDHPNFFLIYQPANDSSLI